MNSWIYTDADNTLWDTDALFAEAQLSLLSAAEHMLGVQASTGDRLKFVREFDQAVAARHHLRLRYPPALLVRVLLEGLTGIAPSAAADRALADGAQPTGTETEAIGVYSSIISGIPPILDGVLDGLQAAHRSGSPVYVISEGPLETVRQRLRALEIEALTAGVLSAVKTPELYARLKQRAAPHRAYMIGDQLDRDIRFAREGGLLTILVAGRFKPAWIQSADTKYADAVVKDFLEAIRVVGRG